MSSKKKVKKETVSKREKFKAGKKKISGTIVLISIAIVFLAIVVVAMVSGGSGKPKEADTAEKKYVGRYLPAGYQEPKLTEKMDYPSTTPMTKLQATTNATELSVPVGAVIQNKIVYFEYQGQSTGLLSMMAYVKPSGKLVVGVSACPPCQSKYQRIETDGTLTCESCGTKRDLETGIGISGACKLYPVDEMPAKVVGDKISIARADLDKWTQQPLDRPVGGQ